LWTAPPLSTCARRIHLKATRAASSQDMLPPPPPPPPVPPPVFGGGGGGGGGATANTAPACASPVIVTAQVSEVPEHAPDQPWNTAPFCGAAVSVTTVPSA